MIAVAALLRDYVQAGATVDEVAARHATTPEDVVAALAAHGVPRRPPSVPLRPVPLGRLAAAVAAGSRDVHELAVRLGADLRWVEGLADHPVVRAWPREPLPWAWGPETDDPAALPRAVPIVDPTELARSYLLEGLTLASMAERFGGNSVDISKQLDAANVPRRPGGYHAQPIDTGELVRRGAVRYARSQWGTAAPSLVEWLRSVGGHFGLELASDDAAEDETAVTEVLYPMDLDRAYLLEGLTLAALAERFGGNSMDISKQLDAARVPRRPSGHIAQRIDTDELALLGAAGYARSKWRTSNPPLVEWLRAVAGHLGLELAPDDAADEESSADELFRLYVMEGLTIAEVAERVGASTVRVRKRMLEVGIPTRSPGWPSEGIDVSRLRELGPEAYWPDRPWAHDHLRQVLMYLGEGVPGPVDPTPAPASEAAMPSSTASLRRIPLGDAPDAVAILRTYALAGRGLPDTARELGVSTSRLRELFRAHGLPVRPQGLPRRTVDLDDVAARGPHVVTATEAEKGWVERVYQHAHRLGLVPDGPAPQDLPIPAEHGSGTPGASGFVECPACGAPRPTMSAGECPWCGGGSTELALTERVCVACDRLRPHRLHARVCRNCEGIRGPHGRFAARQGRCCCDDCVDAELDLRAMVDERLAGDTLETVGDRRGLTRERVRQLLIRITGGVDPTRALKVTVAAEMADIARVRAVVDAVECAACGGLVPGGSGRSAHCSRLCADVANALRYHVDDDRRRKHREIMRRHAASRRRSDLPADPGHRSGARYMQPGSVVWHAAMIALRNAWAIAERLPDEIVVRDLEPYLEEG